MRKFLETVVSDAMFLMGLACIIGGVWMIYPPAGYITAGFGILLLSWVTNRAAESGGRSDKSK